MRYYVVDRYNRYYGDQGHTLCESMKEASELARSFNSDPPWPAWDTIQEERDNH